METENAQRFKLLIAKRDSIKGQLKSFSAFLQTYDEENDTIQLSMRYEAILRHFATFDKICDEIEVFDESQLIYNDRCIIWDEYYKSMSQAQKLSAELTLLTTGTNLLTIDAASRARTNSINEIGSTPGVLLSESQTSKNTTKRKIKLPRTQIPKFNGNLEEWLTFKNSFSSLIHTDDELSGFEKLHHLQAALEGEALRKIQIFPITDENYARAWEHLVKSYNNPRLLISRHLSLLLNLKGQNKDNNRSIENLVDEAQQHRHALASLGVNVSPEIVVQIIEEKFEKSTRAKWEETLSLDKFPTLEEITQFAYKTSASLYKQKRDNVNSNSHYDHGPSAKKRKNGDRTTAHTLVTSTQRCPACSNEEHPLYKCQVFRDLIPSKRFLIVKKANLCYNCLRKHKKGECRHGGCQKCQKNHNTLLHFTKPNNTTESDKSSNVNKD